jgi:hypothetical protein
MGFRDFDKENHAIKPITVMNLIFRNFGNTLLSIAALIVLISAINLINFATSPVPSI